MINLYEKLSRNLIDYKEKRTILNNLWNEKKYVEFYEMASKFKYKRKLKKIQREDWKYEVSSNQKFNSYLFLQKFKRKMKLSLAGFSGVILLLGAIKDGIVLYLNYIANTDNIENHNSEYQLAKLDEIIEQYQEDIEEYANFINDLELSDLEIFVKEMSDMWENVNGYAIPYFEYDDWGYHRYNLYANNYGVCRQFADDCAARLNEINPEYQAQAVSVYACNSEINNIEQYVAPKEENPYFFTKSELLFYELFTEETGNHMVVMATIPKKGYTLIIDPTNPSIGLVDNGKIYMLGSDEVHADYMKFVDVNFYGNLQNYLHYCYSLLQSFYNHTKPSELLEEYGLDKQNEVLEKLQDMGPAPFRRVDIESRIIVTEEEYIATSDGDTLCIEPFRSKEATYNELSSYFYHTINLRLRDDKRIKYILIYSDGHDIDIQKIDVGSREVIYTKVDDGNELIGEGYSLIKKR